MFPQRYLHDVVQQRDSGRVGFGLRQFEQSADLKALGVPCVSALK